MATEKDLPRQLQRMSKAIDEVLIADHGQRRWLKDTVPLDGTYADAVRHYGGPGVGLDLWCMCAAVEKLRIVWLGSNFPLPAEQLTAPDPATAEQPAVDQVGDMAGARGEAIAALNRREGKTDEQAV